MIPKIIHYCWFGGNSKPKLARKCLKSWKRHCRGYKIIEWNEQNYDLSKAPRYVRQAYAEKKWAFVTDYVRLQVIYEQGGIYLDTDVELRKKPDSLLNHQAFFGFESPIYVNTGVGFGAVPGCPILKEMMEDYQDIPFCLEDGSFDQTPCPARNTEVFLRHGLRQDGTMQTLDGDILILPQEYLSPIGWYPDHIELTKNNIAIHWFSASWCPGDYQKSQEAYYQWMKWKNVLEFLSRNGRRLLGENFYCKVRDTVKKNL